MYKNLFPPKYGYLEETEFDEIDFRKPHEKGVKEYSFVTDPKGDIDRTKGYNPAAHSVIPDFDILYNPANEVQITWIRHASFLIQLGSEYQILVDPVMEQYDGLAGTLGKYSEIGTPYADPPLAVKDLPFEAESENPGNAPTNVVAISHDHHDHLNFKTLKKLPENTRYYVPLKVEKLFSSRYLDVTGLDWFTKDMIGDLEITFLPANHRSGRTLNKQNQTLWGGWLFEWNDYRIYYAGDTGYSAVFRDIRQRVGEIDICLMPISAWFQRHWHLAPEDAIEAAQDLECKVLIPWGWGTWIMSFEHILEPPRRLQYAWDRKQPENMELRILKMGETYSIGPLGEEQCAEDSD
ncbi:MAG: MBL fold metallo-hydrolase [Desulfobacterales bacterium]|jgi:L-ascorbate metabolism protein UlaG (beta-lactamase superfamily)